MRGVIRVLGTLSLLLSLSVNAGGIKKWVDEDGKVHYGDVPPPSVTKTESVKVPHSSDVTHSAETQEKAVEGDASSSGGDDYYSPQNQLRRMEEQKEYEQRMHLQRRNDARSEELLQQYKESQERSQKQQDKIDSASCEKYTANVEEYEHRLMGPYSSEEKRLSDKSYLGTLKALQARYCK